MQKMNWIQKINTQIHNPNVPSGETYTRLSGGYLLNRNIDMSHSKHKQILGVHITSIKSEALLKKIVGKMDPEDWYLPEWMIVDNKIVDTADYLGAVEVQPDITYLLLRKQYADEMLDEEISNTGLDDVMGKIDMGPLLDKLEIEDYSKMRLHTHRIVMELSYTCWEDHYSGGYDYDMDITLIGYLNDHLELVTV